MKVLASIYQNLDNKESTYTNNVIYSNNSIKYIDDLKTKITILLENKIMIRENNDYIFTFDFNKNIINIHLKKYNKDFYKDINTIYYEWLNNKFTVKYKLIDEDIINEYHIKL